MKVTPFRPSAPIGGRGRSLFLALNAFLFTLGPPPTLTASLSAAPLLQDGGTALHLASLYGHSAVVEALLVKGADIEAKDKVRGL